MIFYLCTMSSAVFAQGLINFFNNASTLVSVEPPGVLPQWPGTFYFALLTAPTNSTTFTFANVYGTNQTPAGRFTGGANIAVTGWAAGATMQFEVVGWSSDLGTTFNPAWLTTYPASGFFGISGIGTGQAGGFNGVGTLPNLNIFGGTTGIQSGFSLLTIIPEPDATTLAAAGIAVLLIFHRKVRRGGSMPDV